MSDEVTKNKINRKIWETVGIVATTLSTVAFIPPLIQTIAHPEQTSSYDVPLYIITIAADIFWTIYGFHLKSWPVIISSVITIIIGIAFVILATLNKAKSGTTWSSTK